MIYFECRRHIAIGERLGGSIAISPVELAKLGKEYSDIGKIVELFDERSEHVRAIEDLQLVEAEEKKRYSMLINFCVCRYM